MCKPRHHPLVHVQAQTLEILSVSTIYQRYMNSYQRYVNSYQRYMNSYQRYIYIHTGWWWLNHLEKYEFVNGKDDIPNMKWKIKVMSETTNQYNIYIYICKTWLSANARLMTTLHGRHETLSYADGKNMWDYNMISKIMGQEKTSPDPPPSAVTWPWCRAWPEPSPGAPGATRHVVGCCSPSKIVVLTCFHHEKWWLNHVSPCQMVIQAAKTGIQQPTTTGIDPMPRDVVTGNGSLTCQINVFYRLANIVIREYVDNRWYCQSCKGL